MSKKIVLKLIFCFVLFLSNIVSSNASEKQLITCFDGLQPTPQGLCMERVDIPAVAICAGAADNLGGNKCRIRIPKLKQCQEGYIQNASGDCTKEIITDASYYCPAGYLDNDDLCIQRLPGKVKTSCPEGRLEGNQCIVEHMIPLQEKVICPEETKFKENACWKVIDTFDCTGQFECERKCFLDNNCRSHGGRQANSRRNLHELPDLVPVNAPRPVKINIVKQLCEKEIEVPSVIVRQCPQDYLQISETQCSRQSIVPSVSICVETNGPVDSCPDIVMTAEKKSKCAEGTISLPYGKCKRIETIPGTPYCPSDFMTAEDTCVTLVQAPLKCSPDLTLQNGRCVGTRFHPPVTVDTETFRVVTENEQSNPSPKMLSRPLIKKGRNRDKNDVPSESSVLN